MPTPLTHTHAAHTQISVSIGWLEGLSLRMDAAFGTSIGLLGAVFSFKFLAKGADLYVFLMNKTPPPAPTSQVTV